MNWNWQRGKSATLDVADGHRDRGKLHSLIAQATGDSVDESDEHAGLLSMIREEVVCPFPPGSPAKMSNASDSSGPRRATASTPYASPRTRRKSSTSAIWNLSSRVPRATNGSTLTSPGAIC